MKVQNEQKFSYLNLIREIVIWPLATLPVWVAVAGVDPMFVFLSSVVTVILFTLALLGEKSNDVVDDNISYIDIEGAGIANNVSMQLEGVRSDYAA